MKFVQKAQEAVSMIRNSIHLLSLFILTASLFIGYLLSVTDKEIQNIPSVGTLAFIKLGITALTAAYCYEFLILHIKNLGKISSCGLKLITFILLAAAFGTYVLFLLHVHTSQILLSSVISQ